DAFCFAASSTAWRASASVSTPSSARRRGMPVRPGMLGAGFICVAMKVVQTPESQAECIAKTEAWAGPGENHVSLQQCRHPVRAFRGRNNHASCVPLQLSLGRGWRKAPGEDPGSRSAEFKLECLLFSVIVCRRRRANAAAAKGHNLMS